METYYTSEGLQILTYAYSYWAEGSLACHTYCERDIRL